MEINEKSTIIDSNGIIFSSDKKTLIKFSPTIPIDEYEIPEYVHTIGDSAFKGKSILKKIIINENVIKIENNAFYNFQCFEIKFLSDKIEIASESFRFCAKTKLWTVPKFSTQKFVNKIRKFVWDGSELIGEELNFKTQSDVDAAFENQIVNIALSNNGVALKFMRDVYKKNPETVLKAIKNSNGHALFYADYDLKTNREFMLEAVKICGAALNYSMENFINEREFQIEASKTDKHFLYNRMNNDLKEKLSKDREIVLNTIKAPSRGTPFFALDYVHKSLRSDREIVKIAVNNDGKNLMGADPIFLSDKEIVLLALKTCGHIFRELSNDLQMDKKIVMLAVKSDGEMLRYCDETFKSDFEVVKEAIINYPKALRFATRDIISKKEILLEVIKKIGIQEIKWLVDGDILKDKEILEMDEIFRQKHDTLKFESSKELKSDKDYVLNSVKKDGLTIQFASAKLKKDKNIILEAVKNNGLAYEYISF